MASAQQAPVSPSPYSLIAELTHRCPLHCLYCSNPTALLGAEDELSTEDWQRVFVQAGKLGVLHLHLTGGEPLVRKDLVELVASARDAGLYVNMITSGVGLTEQRLSALVDAGLEHLQLSFQADDVATANHVAGARTHELKLALVPLIKKFPVALTINLVVHRLNLDRLPQFLAMAEELGPDRLEIAHVQYYGWALENRALLMPSEEQVRRSMQIIEAAKERLKGSIRVESVVPDYFAQLPKACVGGWARQTMLIDPIGRALPCHAAAVIPDLRFDNVRAHDLAWIWRESAAFQRFRGDAWMPDTCLACPRKEVDWGGCRCQAMLLTGDAAAMDPVCQLSPHHAELQAMRAQATELLPIWRG